MLIPLLAPSESGSAGFSKIAKALGLAAVKVSCPPCWRSRRAAPGAWHSEAGLQQCTEAAWRAALSSPGAAHATGEQLLPSVLIRPHLQAVTAIVGIVAGGRLIVRPIYWGIARIRNNDVFAATTLLIVLGTSVLTQLAGLSLALGAFLVASCLSCMWRALCRCCCRTQQIWGLC